MNLEVIRNEEYLEEANGIVKFGNEFKISIIRNEDEDWNDFQLYWYERTDKPYLPDVPNQPKWEPGKWMNLAPLLGEGSDVFKPWFEEKYPKETVITLTDIPGINLTAGNFRTLEFFIGLSNGTGTYCKARLRQELRYNGMAIESCKLVVEKIWMDADFPDDQTEDSFNATHKF